MKAWAGLAASAILAASPAMAADRPPDPTAPLPTNSRVGDDHSVLLVPQRRMSVPFDDKMNAVAGDEGAADALGFEIPKNDPKIETWFETNGKALFDTGRLRFNLYTIEQPAGSQRSRTILVVSNGRSRDVAYFAALVIGVQGRHVLKPTTICSIRPNGVGIESWGDQVEGILVLKVVESSQPVCTDARTGKFYPPGQQPPPPDPAPAKPN
jgi:hypothetical protein